MKCDIPIRYNGLPDRVQTKGVKPKMRERKLRRGVTCQGA